MTIGFHVVEYVRDFSLRPNHKRRAGDPLHYLAIHIFVFDHSKGVGNFLVGVREQSVGKLVLLLEFELRGRIVGGDA